MDTDNDLVDSLIGNGAEIMARGLDKEAEYQADTMGVVLTARAGYDPYALPVVLQEIGHASQEKDARLLFKTHPHPNDRLDHLATAMDTFSESGITGEKAIYRIK